MKQIKTVGIFAVMHFLVDFICAFTMFGWFVRSENGLWLMLLYNFCAFALQMPLGVVMDAINNRGGRRTAVFAGVGAVLTAGGLLLAVLCTRIYGVADISLMAASATVLILGVGNAMFHVGGGVGTMDVSGFADTPDRSLPALGIFVAPGAVGLFIGTQLGNAGGLEIAIAAMVLMLGLGALLLTLGEGQKAHGKLLFIGRKKPLAVNAQDNVTLSECVFKACNVCGVTQPEYAPAASCLYRRTMDKSASMIKNGGLVFGGVCLFLVVVLRSFAGFTIRFPWNTTLTTGIVCVLALAAGKAAGGIAARRFGVKRTIGISLLLAALLYGCGSFWPAGILALFLFNMTMPVTLYMLARELPGRPGLAFGILTFALFVGFLPVCMGVVGEMDFRLMGSLVSLISFGLLYLGLYFHDRSGKLP